MKFLHTSDWHLGSKFDYLPAEIALKRKEEQRQTVARIFNVATNKESGIDLLLISGDIFDSQVPDYADIQFVKQELVKVAASGVKTYIIPGNHDAYEIGGIWDTEQFAATVFKGSGLQKVADLDLKIDIFGYVYTRENKSHRAMVDCQTVEITTGHNSVLLYHGAFENFGRELGIDYPFSQEEITKTPFNYIALGHYHTQTEVLPQKAHYAGSPEGLKFDKNELGPRYFVLGKINEQGNVELAAVGTKAKEYQLQNIDVTTESKETISKNIQSMSEESQPYLRLILTGTPSPEILEFLPTIVSMFNKTYSYIEAIDDTTVLPQNISFAENSYMKLYVEKIQKRLEGAPSEESKKVLSKALELALAAFYERSK